MDDDTTLPLAIRSSPRFPFGSMMAYAADELGRPTFFVSSMATHTHNLQQDARQPAHNPAGCFGRGIRLSRKR
jgi:putative heme iron utilization protein